MSFLGAEELHGVLKRYHKNGLMKRFTGLRNIIKVSKLWIFVFHSHVYKFDVEEIDPHRFQTADEIRKLNSQVKTKQYIKEVDTWKSRNS